MQNANVNLLSDMQHCRAERPQKLTLTQIVIERFDEIQVAKRNGYTWKQVADVLRIEYRNVDIHMPTLRTLFCQVKNGQRA